ncbi:hypothetical protein [Erythrobacter alti]|uniref:hypothetical protein n=1 Tax=Erythrobacter alti TaxID=1896145 RepID=UPI0030F39087
MNERRQLDIGEILGRTAETVSSAGRDVAVFVLLIGGLGALGVALALTTNIAMEFASDMTASVPGGLAAALFDLSLSLVTWIAGFFLMRRYLEASGRQSSGVAHVWLYLGMSILSFLGLVAGLILLIIPGIILMVRWSAASGFLISGEKGVTQSLGASFEATKGSGWQIFFAAIILLLGLGVIGAVIGGIFGTLSLTVLIYVSAFLEAFSNAIFLAFGIAIYLLLSDGNEAVREVFS